jgi:hypothetical protein
MVYYVQDQIISAAVAKFRQNPVFLDLGSLRTYYSTHEADISDFKKIIGYEMNKRITCKENTCDDVQIINAAVWIEDAISYINTANFPIQFYLRHSGD